MHSSLISGGSNNNYRLIGTYDPEVGQEISNFVLQVRAMKRHKRQGLQFRDLAWKDLVPIVEQETGNPANGTDLLIPFEHEYLVGNMDFLWTENPELPDGDYERAMVEIDRTVNEICGNKYMLKQFRKLLRNPNVEEIEDPSTTGQDTLFLQQQLTESVEALKSQFLCFPCNKGLTTKQSVFAHLKAKHADNLNAHMIGEYRSARLTRAEERADQAEEELSIRDRHHRLAHPDCNDG